MDTTEAAPTSPKPASDAGSHKPGKLSSLKAKIKKLLASQKEMIKDNQNYR
ncbi:uncharacterized protein AB675_3424 [Cyphellophora attinorum]|uniref:Uncharacterized protein n=1 Tax=Cyphellophora attinorum TaxID=1664694 RepID=A0A0N1H8J4_9EURO|nr:uncharacterized protein AB675_3424 [Phialophora attinorum]KPI39682.1 hypothetical protein AB675_3424 [Phialophora attinorum]